MSSTQSLKLYFAIRSNLRNSFSTTLVILYLVTSRPVEILLNNAQQNLQSGQLHVHHWATSDGAEIPTSLCSQ